MTQNVFRWANEQYNQEILCRDDLHRDIKIHRQQQLGEGRTEKGSVRLDQHNKV